LWPETDQLEECDQYKVDEDYAEYNAYRRMVEHARTLERERDEWRKKAVELHKVKCAAHDALIAAGDMIYRIARTNDDYIAAEHFKRCGQFPENDQVELPPKGSSESKKERPGG
jgi:ssDNA-binding Zn-finger/Zn-ribbon topoisomerase 1